MDIPIIWPSAASSRLDLCATQHHVAAPAHKSEAIGFRYDVRVEPHSKSRWWTGTALGFDVLQVRKADTYTDVCHYAAAAICAY